jgi:hypothetical protein
MSESIGTIKRQETHKIQYLTLIPFYYSFEVYVISKIKIYSNNKKRDWVQHKKETLNINLKVSTIINYLSFMQTFTLIIICIIL